jgi:ubiquinone/menaquinone biosynthesis C-methylase UbiE
VENPRWFLDELTRAGPEHLDPAYAAGYDRKTAPHFDPSDEVALLRNLGLDETHTLVDLGAGTGALALAAAEVCRRVVAVDVSSAMLTVATDEADRRGLDNMECVEQGFLTYEHRGEPADFVYSRNALHHLPDFWKAIALERIAGFLRPGGTLRLRDIVFSFEPRDAVSAVEAWLAGAAESPTRGWTRAELEEHMREEHSTFTWLLEATLARTGFDIRDAEYRAGAYAAYVCAYGQRD